MNQDLAPKVSEVLSPSTGEVIELSSPDADLARWLDEARDWESKLREAKHLVQAEILKRMDLDASWTRRDGGYELTGSAPGRTTFNAEELDSALEVLERAGKITHTARRAAVEEVTSLKAKRQGINQLMKLGGEVEELVRSLEKEDPRPRRVNVKVKP